MQISDNVNITIIYWRKAIRHVAVSMHNQALHKDEDDMQFIDQAHAASQGIYNGLHLTHSAAAQLSWISMQASDIPGGSLCAHAPGKAV